MRVESDTHIQFEVSLFWFIWICLFSFCGPEETRNRQKNHLNFRHFILEIIHHTTWFVQSFDLCTQNHRYSICISFLYNFCCCFFLSNSTDSVNKRSCRVRQLTCPCVRKRINSTKAPATQWTQEWEKHTIEEMWYSCCKLYSCILLYTNSTGCGTLHLNDKQWTFKIDNLLKNRFFFLLRCFCLFICCAAQFHHYNIFFSGC